GRHAGAVAVWYLPQSGQIESRETVDRGRASHAKDAFARADERLAVWRMTCQFEGEIRLYGHAWIGRSVREIAPASVRLLFVENVVGRFSNPRIAKPAQDDLHQNEFGLEDRVSFEFRTPMSVW